MVVYMYLNTVTEMSYVGSSLYGLEHRHRRHLKDSQSPKKKSRFHRALADWPIECWELVVLERCNTEVELDAAETRWIAECHSLSEGIGYNTYDSRYLRTAIAGGEAMKRRTFTPEERVIKSICGKKGSDSNEARHGHTFTNKIRRKKFAEMSTEERHEFFKECGRRGTKPRAELTEEERERFRAWGRKGAERSRQLQLERSRSGMPTAE